MIADFSRERRRKASSMLKRDRIKLRQLTADARLLYAVGLLICDEHGHIKESAVPVAMADPSIVQAAHNLLNKAGI